jgi:hypothetical protein
MGANAVIGVCHDATEVMQITEVLCYSTAVRHAALILIVPNLRQSLGAFLLTPQDAIRARRRRHGCDARGAFAARVEPVVFRGQRHAPDAVPSHGCRYAALRR